MKSVKLLNALHVLPFQRDDTYVSGNMAFTFNERILFPTVS